ncbi:hypothetical protein SDRG_09176 [Saprolegnia diclina VS20]|uniref:EF-hand domain-containing protein n=1 Tax=Saprolegnia diclina (strain VS20) TaxID=1156394 RepID=T0RSM4_SAPDV|nr:hypothetical protein SDRG_09176 [Saprolegnia diclina VS20]EQC33192.1 hypothetical protein SDRG_09176 [Saprolegnia diclina VS20]|eukprot:XP_008613315.1 hypothetical protein SDRG_09176 [Saprolegnia diclina VS20]
MITSSSLTASLTPAEKFLKFTGLTIPDPPSMRPVEATSNPEVALTHVDADTKYCGRTAKSEFVQLFRTMVSRQHLDVEPRSRAHQLPELDLTAYKAVIPEDDDEPDFDTMLCEPFTARHEFASLCLERELPPSAGLLLRKTQTPAIDISHYGMGDDLARVWAASIVDVPNVTSLNLRNNRLTDAGLPSIIAALTVKPRIAILDLSENKLDSECVDALATYLQLPVCALQELRMSHADVDDAEIGPVVHALYLNQSVHLLDLSHNLLGSHERRRKTPRGTTLVGGEAIGAMLEANTTLRSLDLSWNTLRLSGAVAIGRGLGRNNALLELNLAYNAIGEMGAAAVGVALGSNVASKLERVDLSDNNVSAQAALVLSQTILVNARLRFLVLDGNPLGSQGGRSLFHAVAQCPNKQLRISMQRCNFDLNVHNASKFNPDDVSGQYELDLAVPYERSIAIELVRCATRKNGCRFKSILYVPPPNKASRRASAKPMAVQVLLTTTSPPGMLGTAEPQSRAALEALFHQLDYDTSGAIDETELARGMRRLGLDARESDVRKLLARYDLDGSGTIEVDEFVDMMSWLYRQAALKLQAQSVRQLLDVRTNEPLEVPAIGHWIVDFVDLRLPADAVEAESLTVGGLDHLLRNIRENANKVQLLHVAKQGMVLSSDQAQTILDHIMEGLDTVHAMASLLPYMIDCRNACVFIDTNLSEAARGRLQHLLLQAYGPIVGMASDHYKLDLADALDRSTAKKLLEMNNKCALEWPRLHPLQPTDERCFRNAYHSGSAVTLDAKMLTWRFGVLEFDFVHRVRPPKGTLPLSSTRFAQVLAKLQMNPVKETPKWRKVGKDGVIKRSPKVYERLRELRQMKHAPPAVDRAAITCSGENGTEVVLTARRLLMELQAALCTRYVSAQQVRGILLQWPPEFAASRVDALVFMFDRLVDLHHFYQIEAILTDAEVAQCLHRLGWLNTWTPLIPEMYYELDMAIYEEREITKYLIALALAEPGENWIGETFGWTLDTTIPGWKLNAQWTSDETMPRKGILRLEYYSGADQGCSPIWHVRQNLCSHMLAHPLTPDELDDFRTTVTM